MPTAASNRPPLGLSAKALDQLLAFCTTVDLPLRTVLYEPGVTPKYAYFMTSGMASVVTPMIDGGTAEVEVIGHNGLVGSFHLLGPAPVPTSCFIQIAASGLQIELDRLRDLFNGNDEIRTKVLEFVQCQALAITQIAGCNRLHEAEARLSRWLLTVQDVTGLEVLPLTQQFLAQMLGTQRTTVTTTAGALQQAGFIEYWLGNVKIIDRPRLEMVACECYQITKHLYTRFEAVPATE